jgi:hypothetical protein
MPGWYWKIYSLNTRLPTSFLHLPADLVCQIDNGRVIFRQFLFPNVYAAVLAKDSQRHFVTHPILLHLIISLTLNASFFQGRIQPIHIVAAFDKEVVNFLGILEAIPGGVDEGYSPPTQADNWAGKFLERAKLDFIIIIISPRMVGLVGQQVAAAKEFVAQLRSVVVNGPLIGAKFSAEIKSEILRIQSFGHVTLGDAIPAFLLDNGEIGRSWHVSNQNTIFGVHANNFSTF